MKAAFLDRDGVINRKPPEGRYVTCWNQLQVLDRVAEAVQLLNLNGYVVILVTNQRCVARGLLTEDKLISIHQRLCDCLAAQGAVLDAIYYCPHDVGECACRKPGTGMLERARNDFALDFKDCILVGDSTSDIEAGARAGCRTVLIADEQPAWSSVPIDLARATSLYEAVQKYMLGHG